MADVWAQYLLAALAGLVAGSFTTTLIYRLPRMCGAQAGQGGADRSLSMWWPRSHCTDCGHTLGVRDLVPFLSWVFLRGRCRYCDARIAATYPLVEASLAILACLLVAIFGFGLHALAGLVFVTCLLALSVIDARTLMLPDVLTLSFLWLGLLINIADSFADLTSAVIGAFVGYAVLWTLYQLHRWLRGVEGMGYGDFKLLAGIGAWLGWQDLPLVVMVGAMSGLVWASILWLRGRLDSGFRMPFGPFLSIGALAGLLLRESFQWPGL